MKKYERRNQDIGNIVAFEHANVRVPDQQIATAFYVMGLGFTRDPYLMVGLDNMWINLGQQQFHLPTGAAQVFPGFIDMVVPDLDALTTRLSEVKDRLAGTKFTCSVEDKHVSVTCPWGNRMRLYAPGPQFGDLTLGTVAVESPVALGHAAGIARFYETVMQAPATVTPSGEGSVARVKVGPRTDLVFRETAAEIPAYDGHHIAIYISDFSGTHRRLGQRRLDQRGEQRVPVPLQGHRGSRHGRPALHPRARGPLLHSSDVPAAAREPESRPAPADVSARA